MATIKRHRVGGVLFALERIEALEDDSLVLTETGPRGDMKILYQFDDPVEAEAVYAGHVGAAMIRARNRPADHSVPSHGG